MLTVFMYASRYGLDRNASGGTVGGVIEVCGDVDSYFGWLEMLSSGGVVSVVSELFSGMYHVNQKSLNKLYQFDICSMPCSEPLGDIDNVRSVLQHAEVGIAIGSGVAQCLILSDQTLLYVLTGCMALNLAGKYGLKLFGIYDM